MVTTLHAVVIGIAAFFLGGVIGVAVMAIVGMSKDDFGRDCDGFTVVQRHFETLPGGPGGSRWEVKLPPNLSRDDGLAMVRAAIPMLRGISGDVGKPEPFGFTPQMVYGTPCDVPEKPAAPGA